MASSVLAPVQERGRAALEQLGLPNRRQEPWRLTDLKRLAAVSELPASASPLSTSLPASLDGVTRLVLNGFDDPLACLLYTSPSPRDKRQSRMPSSA